MVWWLFDVYLCDLVFVECVIVFEIGVWMCVYFGEELVLLCVYYNCMMMKYLVYGSLIGWYCDFCYWVFECLDMVLVWFVFGFEINENGVLWFVLGLYMVEFGLEVFDDVKFFCSDVLENCRMIEVVICLLLQMGDVVFFYCNMLYLVGQNCFDQVKFLFVYMYYGVSNWLVFGMCLVLKLEVQFQVLFWWCGVVWL